MQAAPHSPLRGLRPSTHVSIRPSGSYRSDKNLKIPGIINIMERLVLKLGTTLFQRTTEAKDDQQEPVQTFRDLRKDFGYSRAGFLPACARSRAEHMAIRLSPREFKHLQAR